jgi:hypothetical protein
MAKVSGPYVLPEEHAAMIGRIADAWAQLEFQIDRGTWTLLRTDQQRAACVTAQLTAVHQKMRAFIALVEVLGGNNGTISGLKKLNGEILSGGLQEQRNRAVHDPRMLHKPSDDVHRLEVTAKPKVHFGFKPESVNDLRQTHERIYEAITKLIGLRDAAIAEIEALPPESRPLLMTIVELR